MKYMATILSVLLVISPLHARESKEKSGTADINIGVGELQETGTDARYKGSTQPDDKTSPGRISKDGNDTPAALPQPQLDNRNYRE